MNQDLPEKIRKRLNELVEMGEFEQWEVEACENGYWNNRDEWHTILINCYNNAKERCNGK